jgi:hypothetical protein
MTQLVFVHGRAQQHKDAAALKAEWIAAWSHGLDLAGLNMPIGENDIRFPYYGDTLFDLAEGVPDAEVAKVVIKGMADGDTEQRDFIYSVLHEIQVNRGISDTSLATSGGARTTDKGVLNWPWVQALLETLDRNVPFASGTSIALATNDVYQYLDNPGIRDVLESGVRDALKADEPTIIVAHSLGTVVAYNLLRREGKSQRWNVPLFVTLGSPLAVSAIRAKLSPHRYPEVVGKWFNAFDERDVVALFPLDAKNFPMNPAIVNKSDVKNLTPNRHGISGYLSDPDVARIIHDALTR